MEETIGVKSLLCAFRVWLEMERIATLDGEIKELNMKIVALQEDVEKHSLCIREKMKGTPKTSNLDGKVSYATKLKGLLHDLNQAWVDQGQRRRAKELLDCLQGNKRDSTSGEPECSTLKRSLQLGESTFSVNHVLSMKRKKFMSNMDQEHDNESIQDYIDDHASPLESPNGLHDFEETDSNSQAETKTKMGSTMQAVVNLNLLPVLKIQRLHPEINLPITTPPKIRHKVKRRSRRRKVDPTERINRLSCDVCLKELDREEFFDHLYSHIGDFTMNCPNPDCHLAFLTRFSPMFQRHLSRNKVCKAVFEKSGIVNKMVRTCDTCMDGVEFKTVMQLGVHLKTHETANKDFACPIQDCEATFSTRQTVECHLYMNHNFNLSKMRKNVKKSDEKNRRPCPICSLDLNVDEMGIHIEKEHNLQETLQCKKCPLKFWERTDYLDHAVRTHVSDGVECEICEDGAAYFSGYFLREHYFKKHQVGEAFLCEFCKYIGFSEKNLHSHRLEKHSRKGRQYKCTVCNPPLEFKNLIAFETHNIKEHGAEPKKCRYCSITFLSASQHIMHESEHRRGGKPRPSNNFTCPICNKITKGKRYHEAHLRSHSDERNFKCDQCVKSYKTSSTLLRHQEMEHNGKRDFCETCGKGFKGKRLLEDHQRIHSGERPFTCEFCGAKFRTKSSLFNHTRGHKLKGDNFKPKGTFERSAERRE